MNLQNVSSEFLSWAQSCSKKERAELDAVINFLQYEGVNDLCPSDFVMNPSEPIDIQYKTQSFQVVHADFNFQKSMGMATSTNHSAFVNGPSRTKSEIWNALIIDPLRKKSHYGTAAKGITLLISSHLSTSLVEKEVVLNRLIAKRELARLGFDAIYLVAPAENLRVFP